MSGIGLRVPCHQLVEQGHQLGPLGGLQRPDDAGLRLRNGALHLHGRLLALVRHPQQLAAPVARIGLAPHPALGLEPADHRSEGGGVECHLGGQRDLVLAGVVDQGVEDGELHRRDVETTRLLHEDGHRHLVGAADQVARRMLEIEAFCHAAV